MVNKLSKTELAKQTGLSRIVISQILNGKQKNPRYQTLKKIATALDCSIEDVMGKEHLCQK